MHSLEHGVVCQGHIALRGFEDHPVVAHGVVRLLGNRRLCGRIALFFGGVRLPGGLILQILGVGRLVFLQGFRVAVALQEAGHLCGQVPVHHGIELGPENQRAIRAAAVKATVGIHPFFYGYIAPVTVVRVVAVGEGISLAAVRAAAVVLPGGIGGVVPDLLEPLLLFFQLQLQLLYAQPLLFQGQVVQGGIEGQQQIPFFDMIALPDLHTGDGLGVGEHNGLDIIRPDQAGGGLLVAPVVRHAADIKIVDVNGLAAALGGHGKDACTDSGHRQHGSADDHCFFGNFKLHVHCLPGVWSAARRPECDRPSWPAWQCPGRG